MPDAKPCTGCGEVKPLDDYHRDRGKPDGRYYRCKTCVVEYQRRYYEQNRDKKLEHGRRYREKNRDKKLENQRRYREENRDKLREAAHQYWEENREFIKRSTARRIKEKHDNTALTATRNGKPWTPAEDDILTADDGRNLFAKALLLGRTYNACATRRMKINHAAA